MATKRARPTKTEESKIVTEARKIDREVFDWGARLTARPFAGTEHQDLVICSEIGNYRKRRGAEVCITFPAASRQNPLRLLDAHNWAEAMTAIVAETRVVQAELRKAALNKNKKKRNQKAT